MRCELLNVSSGEVQRCFSPQKQRPSADRWRWPCPRGPTVVGHHGGYHGRARGDQAAPKTRPYRGVCGDVDGDSLAQNLQ
eukprot:7386436-Pyramimonas_sp.AAC.1